MVVEESISSFGLLRELIKNFSFKVNHDVTQGKITITKPEQVKNTDLLYWVINEVVNGNQITLVQSAGEDNWYIMDKLTHMELDGEQLEKIYLESKLDSLT